MESISTEFGHAKINKKGYYQITSAKEGNNGKRLHRLIYEHYHKCTILPNHVVHHLDNNKLNNNLSNLKLMSTKEHSYLHHKNFKHDEESKKKISKSLTGRIQTDENKLKISASNNTSGYFRVSKQYSDKYMQGFTWRYRYYDENGNRRVISSTELPNLKEKVLDKGLLWKQI